MPPKAEAGQDRMERMGSLFVAAFVVLMPIVFAVIAFQVFVAR